MSYLTLNFFGKDPVVLQYHPNSLVLKQQNNSNTILGINNVITYIAKPKTTLYEISFSTVVTAVNAPTKNTMLTGQEVAIAAGITTGIGAISLFGSGNNIVASSANAVSVAKGAVDLTSGLIYSAAQIKRSITFDQNQQNILSNLRSANRNTTPCTINWDIENSTTPDSQEYFVSNLVVSTRAIQEETGNTIAYDLDILLKQYGQTNVTI